jgi:hypothetical protein
MKCPVCATELQQGGGNRSRETLRSELLTEDFLHREIPKTVLPEAVHLCPLCALKLEGAETKCPRCGVPLGQIAKREEEMLECPECGTLTPTGSKLCPKCGVGFEGGVPEISAPPAQDLPPPPMPARPEHLPERPLPEIIPVSPAPAPMPSGQGLVNGRGAINGTGLVNGTGMVNGTRGALRPSQTGLQKSVVRRWQFLAILIAIVVIVPTFVFLTSSNESSPFAVDGDFHEWSGVEAFSAYTQSGSDSIDLTEWAVQPENDGLYVYLMTEGILWTSSDVTSFYLFIDSDNDPLTGYAVSDIGADYLIGFDGWNGSVQSATVSEYVASSRDFLNWNSWQNLGSISAISSGRQLEALADMPVALGANSRFLLVSQNSFEQSSMSYSVPAQGGLLVMKQEPGPAIDSDGIIIQSNQSALMRLRLSCEGADGTLNSIASGFSNVPLAADIPDIDLHIGVETVIDVMVDTSAATMGSVVYGNMVQAVIDSSFAEVEIIGDGVSAYVGMAPSAIVIDGAFGDWSGRTTADSDSVANTNPDIDITDVGAVNNTDASYFYVGVLGGMCNGSKTPVIKQIPAGGGGGGGGTPPRKTGEDIMNIYIDADLSSATGFAVSLASKVIGAEYKIEIRGLNGNIIARSLLHYAGGVWTYGSATISAEKDLRRMEVGIPASNLNGASSIDFMVEMTDWRSRTDIATSVPQGTRAMTGGILSSAGIDSWVVDGTTTSSSATAMSYQRKLFYDGINFWSFFYDGANTVYKYSSDSGVTWSTSSRAFSSNNMNEASVWFDSSTNTVYAIGDRPFSSTNVRLRAGTVSPSAHTITWDGNDVTLTVSTLANGGKNTYISKDSLGYIWVMSTNQTQVTPTYDLTVFRSRNVNSTAAFFATGSMIGGDSQATAKGSVVNVGTGSDMLAVFGYSGNVASRIYSSGSWSGMTTIYAIGGGNPGNTDNAPPCVVVDGKGVAHLVYGNGHEQSSVSKPYIYYHYFNGAWSSFIRLDTVSNSLGNFFPTISLDRATGNVFALWVETDNNGVGYSVMARKNVTGTWTWVSLTSNTIYEKYYLTSIYSAPNESTICWQWTQNTAGTLQVHFDRIPEFKDVAIPVVVMMTVFLFVRRGRSRKTPDA